MYADPVAVAREFEAGRARAAVDGVVAGVADPPGPDELRAMVDQVLRGISTGDFADVLLRAAAFARVVATGRAELADGDAAARRGSSRWPSSWTGPPAELAGPGLTRSADLRVGARASAADASLRPVQRLRRVASPRSECAGGSPVTLVAVRRAAAAPGPTSAARAATRREALPVRRTARLVGTD